MTLDEAMEALRSVAAGARGSNRALRAVHEVIAAYDAEREVSFAGVCARIGPAAECDAERAAKAKQCECYSCWKARCYGGTGEHPVNPKVTP